MSRPPFVVKEPKRREVFAACFRDRIVHHYVIMRLEPLFEEWFGDRTFNCRKGKGVLYGLNMLREDIRVCSHDYTQDCWIMKLDLKGFFMSIDKRLMDAALRKFILLNYKGEDIEDILYLTHTIVMHSPEKNCVRRSALSEWDALPPNKSLFTNGDGLGMPIGNLSSQHFANYLLSFLDRYMERLGLMHHGRYVDDFYVVHTDKRYMLKCVGKIRTFLKEVLHVTLHPDKFYIQHYSKGVTFTGAVVKFGRLYPARRTVHNFWYSIEKLNRANSEWKLEKAISSVNSYLGIMLHMESYGIRKNTILNMMTTDAWDKVYVKGHFQSVHRRLNWRKRPLDRKDYPKVYYADRLDDHEL